jgi:hypothetical protein
MFMAVSLFLLWARAFFARRGRQAITAITLSDFCEKGRENADHISLSGRYCSAISR